MHPEVLLFLDTLALLGHQVLLHVFLNLYQPQKALMVHIATFTQYLLFIEFLKQVEGLLLLKEGFLLFVEKLCALNG